MAFRSLAGFGLISYFGCAPKSGKAPEPIAVEARKTTRYLLATTARYRWVSAEGQLLEDRGVTRDISTSGVFLLAQMHPPLGAGITLEISLPNLDDTGTGARLFGVGQVIRAERTHQGESGFAISVHFHSDTSDLEAMAPSHTQVCDPTRRP